MKKHRRTTIAALFILLYALSVTAQSGDKAAVKSVQAKEQARIDALLRGDPDAVEAVYADDYILVTERGEIQTKSFRKDALRSGTLKFEKIEIEDRSFRVYGDTVIILSREKLTIKLNGKPAGGDLRLTRVYKLIRGQWKLVASHGSAIK